MSVTVEINVPTKHSTVNSALFGGNMESTRQTFFGGLTAQLINNRKFFAVTDGNFKGWNCQGDVICGNDFNKSVCRSYYPILKNATIKQHSNILVASKERKYQFCLWGESKKGAVITVKWGGAWHGEFTLEPSLKPQQLSAEFVSTADSEAEFSISVNGCAAIYCVSLMPSDNISGMRKDVLDALKECGITALRFPGGCYAEVYSWKDGLLPVDNRPPIDSSMYDGTFLFRNTYGYDCHEIGTDEFMVLCSYIGAKPNLTVPIINYDVKNTVDWVEYCNGNNTEYGSLRVKRGITEPYGVECWFVGNEIYYFGKEIADNGNIAGEKEKEFINAIKTVDSSAKTVVGFCPNMSKWSADSIGVCGSMADIISHHYYYTNEFEDNFGKTTIGEALDVEKFFRESLDKTVESASKTSKKLWDISVDEWSYDWGNRGHNLSALVDSIILHFMINHADEYRIKQAFYFHPVNEGIVKVLSNKTEFDIMGEIWKMFKLHCGNTICEVSCNSSDLSIAASKNSTNIILTVVNRNIDKPQMVKFGVSGVPQKWTQLVPEAVSAENNNFTLETITDLNDTITLAPGSVSLIVFNN